MKIKKSLIILLFIFIAIIMVPDVVNATVGDEFTIDGIIYKVLTEEENNYTVEVSGYDRVNSPVNVILNSAVENNGITYSVIRIGEYAFQFCTSLESIEIPNSVETIEMLAFHSCTSLENIKIPNSVRKIGAAAFGSCVSLESIEIPNSVNTIERAAFEYCRTLKSIKIPNSVTSIEYFTFGECTSLENVEIPNSVKTIEQAAFHTCTALKTIKIPNSVTLIGNYVFYNCSFNIAIPESVILIGENSIPTGNGVTIYGFENSYAEEFSINNGNAFEKLSHSVKNTLSGMVSDGVSYAHTDLGDYVTTLTANAGYKLPDTITVKVGGVEITDYTYNNLNGEVVIGSSAITGDVEIIASAIKISEYTVTINSVEGAIINPTGIHEGILEGSNFGVEIKADKGYKIKSIKVNGVEQTLPLNNDILTIENITEDKNVVVEVEKEKIENNESNMGGGTALRQINFLGDSQNQKFIKGIDKTLVFILDNDRGNGKVYVNSTELSEENGDYTWQFVEGIYPTITLSEEYMKTLKPGEYTIKFEVDNVGEAETIFNVVEQELNENENTEKHEDINDIEDDEENISDNDSENPQTGDNIIIYIASFIISILGISAIIINKKHNTKD